MESLLYWNYLNLLFIRPVLAISFALSFIILGWFLAWKLVLVHVPLIQEIFGLRKKHIKPKPTGLHRYSKFYKEINTAKSSTDCLNAVERHGNLGYEVTIKQLRIS